MAGLVDDDGAREDQDVILPFAYVDAVSVGEAEPALRHGRDDMVTAPERVFVIEEIARRFEIVGAGHVHGKPVMKNAEQVALDHRGESTAAMNFVGAPERKHLLLDERELLACHVPEGQLVAET